MNALESLKQLSEKHRRLADIYDSAYQQAVPIIGGLGEIDLGEHTIGNGNGKKVETSGSAGTTTEPKRRGRKPGSGGGKRPQNDMPLPDLILKILGKHKGGLKLSEVVAQVMDSGYKTSSKKALGDNPAAGYTQLVYQAIRKLRERDPIVVDKDEDSSKYFLVKAA